MMKETRFTIRKLLFRHLNTKEVKEKNVMFNFRLSLTNLNVK